MAHCLSNWAKGSSVFVECLALGSLFLTSPSLAQTPPDNRNDFPPIFTQAPLGVNLQTGRLRYGAYDMSIGPFTARSGPNAETGFSFPGKLYWRTVVGYAGSQQPTMSVKLGELQLDFSYISYVLQGSTPVPLAMPYFTGQTAGTIGWRLEKRGAQYFLTNKSGDTYVFGAHPSLVNTGYPDNDQVPISLDYADGHRLDFLNDVQARLKAVLSNRGYAVVFEVSTGGVNRTICGFNTALTYVDASTGCSLSALKVAHNNVAINAGVVTGTVTDAFGNTRQSYLTAATATTPQTLCVTFINSGICETRSAVGPLPGEPAGLTKSDQVRQQTTATGDVWNYAYENADSIDPVPLRRVFTSSLMTDPLGRATSAIYFNGFVQSIQAPEGFTQYTFAGILPAKKIYPEGNIVEYKRDTIGNLLERIEYPKPGSNLASLIMRQTFPQPSAGGVDPICFAASHRLCDKPLTRTDERGNQTDYVYDPLHGGILSETGPIVNGIRPQMRYSYAQRYAWIKNSAGAFVQAATPIWVLTQKSQCKSGTALGAGCAVVGDEVRTTFEYGPNSGPNNLLLRGMVDDATGAALRTCYAYDWQGNKISETKPRANLATCP